MKRIQWFSAFRYVVPAQYEEWFENLASKGWHPTKVHQWSSLAMVFEKGKPRKYKYCVDLQAKRRKDYMTIYQDFGWEYIGQMASMHLWRKPYEGDNKPESFTDKDSMAKRNRRFVYAISVAFYIFLLTMLVTIALLILHMLGITKPDPTVDFLVDRVLPIILSGLFTWYLGAVIRRIKKFNNR